MSEPQHPDTVVDAVVRILLQQPSAMLTDIDGTISEISATPDEAFVVPEAIAALVALRGPIDYAGVITGRSSLNATKMLSGANIQVIGNHGLEGIGDGEAWTNPVASKSRSAIEMALNELREQMKATDWSPGVMIEDKGLSASVHYRMAADPMAAEQTLQPLLTDLGERFGLRVTTGKMVFELRPPVEVNKGTAIAELANRLQLKGIVFLGDDTTDVDGFRALEQLRQSGLATLSIAVAGTETPKAVLESADITIIGVAAAVELLQLTAMELGKSTSH